MRKAAEKPLLTFIEASMANNTPVPAPFTTVSEADEVQRLVLIEAIATVKTAGYRVVKPRKPKTLQHNKKRVGPTFVAKFADGTVTRMSTFTSLEKLDWRRGVRLSQAAYQSRWTMRPQEAARYHTRREHEDAINRHYARVAPPPPAIVSAHFEQDGTVLARYEQRDLQ
jgi:hypothetical protein